MAGISGKFGKRVVRRSGWAEVSMDFFFQTLAVVRAEVHKLLRDPSGLLSRAVQPLLWLAVFGQVFSRVRDIPTAGLNYVDFMAPGILGQSILFSGIFFGIAVIWERDLGIVHKLLVTPASRAALVLGKAMSAGMRGLVQAAVVYAVAAIVQVDIRWDVSAVASVALGVFLGACIFATFSLLIACVVMTRERFMGIGQILTMPLFFASNAIYPLELMPDWLRVIALVNPLTYLIDALRASMVVGGVSQHGALIDFVVMGGVFLLLLAAATRLYPRLGR
jgi:ABC-2 type transport system permease protein